MAADPPELDDPPPELLRDELGRYRPGCSGNPAGRPPLPVLSAVVGGDPLLTVTPRVMVTTLAALALDPDVSAAARVQAARAVLSWQASGRTLSDVRQLTDADLAALAGPELQRRAWVRGRCPLCGGEVDEPLDQHEAADDGS